MPVSENNSLAEAMAESWLQSNPVLERKVVRALLCSPVEARVAVAECVKFLTLVADNHDGSLTPSHRVDLVWHEMILFTRAYTDFCFEQFQRFIHHQPSEDTPSNRRQFKRTLSAYQSRFGDPPVEFWGDGLAAPAACGNCESVAN